MIVATASATHASILTLTHNFLSKVLQSKFIDTLIDSHIKKIKYDESKRKEINAKIVDGLISLLLLCIERLPTQTDAYLEKIEYLILFLESLTFEFVLITTKNKLKKLSLALEVRLVNYRFNIKNLIKKGFL